MKHSPNGLNKQILLEDELDRDAAAALRYKLSNKPIYWDNVQQVSSMSKSWKFVVFYTALILIAATLLYVSFSIPAINATLSNFWGVFILTQCWSYMIAGVGLALPVCVIAFGLGWLQFYLIINGQIEPHLTSEGFGSALETIFSKFLE